MITNKARNEAQKVALAAYQKSLETSLKFAKSDNQITNIKTEQNDIKDAVAKAMETGIKVLTASLESSSSRPTKKEIQAVISETFEHVVKATFEEEPDRVLPGATIIANHLANKPKGKTTNAWKAEHEEVIKQAELADRKAKDQWLAEDARSVALFMERQAEMGIHAINDYAYGSTSDGNNKEDKLNGEWRSNIFYNSEGSAPIVKEQPPKEQKPESATITKKRNEYRELLPEGYVLRARKEQDALVAELNEIFETRTYSEYAARYSEVVKQDQELLKILKDVAPVELKSDIELYFPLINKRPARKSYEHHARRTVDIDITQLNTSDGKVINLPPQTNYTSDSEYIGRSDKKFARLQDDIEDTELYLESVTRGELIANNEQLRHEEYEAETKLLASQKQADSIVERLNTRIIERAIAEEGQKTLNEAVMLNTVIQNAISSIDYEEDGENTELVTSINFGANGIQGFKNAMSLNPIARRNSTLISSVAASLEKDITDILNIKDADDFSETGLDHWEQYEDITRMHKEAGIKEISRKEDWVAEVVASELKEVMKDASDITNEEAAVIGSAILAEALYNVRGEDIDKVDEFDIVELVKRVSNHTQILVEESHTEIVPLGIEVNIPQEGISMRVEPAHAFQAPQSLQAPAPQTNQMNQGVVDSWSDAGISNFIANRQEQTLGEREVVQQRIAELEASIASLPAGSSMVAEMLQNRLNEERNTLAMLDQLPGTTTSATPVKPSVGKGNRNWAESVATRTEFENLTDEQFREGVYTGGESYKLGEMVEAEIDLVLSVERRKGNHDITREQVEAIVQQRSAELKLSSDRSKEWYDDLIREFIVNYFGNELTEAEVDIIVKRFSTRLVAPVSIGGLLLPASYDAVLEYAREIIAAREEEVLSKPQPEPVLDMEVGPNMSKAKAKRSKRAKTQTPRRYTKGKHEPNITPKVIPPTVSPTVSSTKPTISKAEIDRRAAEYNNRLRKQREEHGRINLEKSLANLEKVFNSRRIR